MATNIPNKGKIPSIPSPAMPLTNAKNTYALTLANIGKKPKAPITPATNTHSLVTSNVMGNKAPAPSQSSATPPIPAPKQAFVNNMTSSSPDSASSDLSGLLPNLQKLRDQLGSYQGGSAPASTPSTPTTPAVDPYEKTRSAMESYINSLKPTSEENDLQRRLDNLRESTRAGVARQEEDAIPMSFITGRQATIENRGKEMTSPLEAELARFAGNRTAMSEAEKARFEFEQSLGSEANANARDDAAIAREEARYNQGTLQKSGDDIIRVLPDGTSEVVYKGTPEVETQVVQSGGRNVLINSKTGAVIANLGATEGALTRANSGSSSSYGGASGLSETAQNILAQINRGADINELIKGNSIESQRLRNEVIRGLNAQGGYADKDNLIIEEGKALVDEMLKNKAYRDLGGLSTRLGFQFGEGYGDATAQANQLTSILSRDNLGLLKGAMSDADLAFIKSMSSGFEGEGMRSETYIKNRLETIQTKLEKRLSGTSFGNSNPTQGADVSSMSDEELERIANGG